MITLNQNEQATLNKMIETSSLMGETLTQEEMNYYNTNYGEQNADAATMDEISRKLRELMTIDTENAEVLRNVYPQEFSAVERETEKTNVEANYTGFKKMFNYKTRNKAKARQAQVLSKKELLDGRKEFDATYNTAHENICTEYQSYMHRVQLIPSSTPEDISLERVVSILGFRNTQSGGNSDEIQRKENVYEFLRSDSSKASKLKKLETYSTADREYKYAASEFSFAHNDIATDWVSRDIVGYTCKIDKTDKSINACYAHALNLDKIVVNQNEKSEQMNIALSEEMDFLAEQVDDMYRWKDEKQMLFEKNLPSGRVALGEYVALTRAIKKLQISKTATKAIYRSAAYKDLDKAKRKDFENNTMRKIWAMHSYISGLIALASRYYSTIMNDSALEGKLLSWDETVKKAEAEDFSKSN